MINTILNKIKKYLIAGAAFVGAVFYAYFFGKDKGENDEKIKNMQNIQKNLGDAAKARRRLNDPDTAQWLHDRYDHK